MSSAPRKPAQRLARPAARYWKGKAPKGADEVLPDSDEEEELQQPEEEGDIQIGDQDFEQEEDEDETPIRAVAKPVVTKSVNLLVRAVIDKDGRLVPARNEEAELGVCSCYFVALVSCATRVVCT